MSVFCLSRLRFLNALDREADFHPQERYSRNKMLSLE